MAMKAAGNESVVTRYTIEVLWEREAIEMARYFVAKCTARECQWFHFIDKFVDEKAKKITYWISGMKIPEQTVTGTTVEADGHSMLKLFLEMRVETGLMVNDAEGKPIPITDPDTGERVPPTDEQVADFNSLVTRMAVWCHSHVQMACSPSGTDNEQWEDWIKRLITDENPTQPVMMVIMNQKDEYFCRLYDPQNGALIINPAFNIYDSIDYKYIEDALKNRLKQKTYNAQNNWGQGTGSYHGQGNSSHTNNTTGFQGSTSTTTTGTAGTSGSQGNSQGGQSGQLTSHAATTAHSPSSGTQGQTSPSSSGATGATTGIATGGPDAPSDKFVVSYLGAEVPVLAKAAQVIHRTFRCNAEADEYIKTLEGWFDEQPVAWYILDKLLFDWKQKPQLKDLFEINGDDPAVKEHYKGAKSDLRERLTSADAPCESAYIAAAEIAFVYIMASHLVGDAAGSYQKDWDRLVEKSQPERDARDAALIAMASRQASQGEG
jgi:hypothetical protein